MIGCLDEYCLIIFPPADSKVRDYVLTVLVTQELKPTTEKAKDNVPKYPNSRLTKHQAEFPVGASKN